MLFPSWLSSITFFEGPSFLGLFFASPQSNSVCCCCRGRVKRENEPFSTAQRSERVENFLFCTTREYTEAGIEQRGPGTNSPEPRRCAVPGWHVSAQKTSSYITARPWLPGLIVGPFSSEESLCCPACPPPPFFADSRRPVSKVACLISLYLLSTCMYHTFSHITFLGYNHVHMNSRASVFLDSLLSEHIIRYHMRLWGRLFPGYHTRFFLQRGCCCQGKEVVPVDHIRGKGLSSCLTSWSKIRLIAAFEQCPQGPAPNSFSYSTLSQDPPWGYFSHLWS